MKLTIEELKELLPGEYYLDQRGKNLVGNCPQCGYDEFGISVEEGHRFGCYRTNKCGFNGNIKTLLRFLGKEDEVATKRSSELLDPIENGYYFRHVEDKELEECSMPLGFRPSNNIPYLNGRGFTEEDYKKYPVGQTKIFDKFKGFVIFKVINDGKNVGYVARNVKSKGEIDAINDKYKQQGLRKKELRYKNSISDFEAIVYGLDEITEKTKILIIAEGIFDKIRIDQLLELHHQEDIKCVATFKANISDVQILKMFKKGRNITKAILLYDSDVIKKIKETVELLEERVDVEIGYHPTKDPGDMNEQDLDHVLDNLYKPIHFHTSILEVGKLED